MPVVMAERSPLTIDGNASFGCHAVMSSMLLCGADGMAPIFARGRNGFIKFFVIGAKLAAVRAVGVGWRPIPAGMGWPGCLGQPVLSRGNPRTRF